MKCSVTAADRHSSTHAPSTSCLLGCSQAGWPHTAAQALGHGELEAPALSWALELNPSHQSSVWRPFGAGAELQSAPARAGACCLHSLRGGGSDLRCFDAKGAAGRAAAWGS